MWSHDPTTEPKKNGTTQSDNFWTEQAVKAKTPEENNQPNINSGGFLLQLFSLIFQGRFTKGEKQEVS